MKLWIIHTIRHDVMFVRPLTFRQFGKYRYLFSYDS